MMRLIILSLSLVIIIIGAWLSLRALALSYQSRAGELLQHVTLTNDESGFDDIQCAQVQHIDETTHLIINGALNNLQKALRFNPKLAQAYLLSGRAYCLLGEPEKAVKAYRNFTRMRPQNPLGHLKLGFALAASRKEKLAATELRKAGLYSYGFIEQGNILRERLQFKEALWWYEHAEKFEPGAHNYWYYYGLVYEGEGSFQLAVNAYHRAFEYGNTPEAGKSDILYRIGIIGIGLYDPELSIHSFKEALKQDNFVDQLTKADGLFRYAVLMEGQGTPASSFIPELQEAIRLNPYHAGAHAMLGTAIYQADHDVPQAIIELETALKINPREKWAYIRLANIYYSEKDWEKCAEVFTNMAEIFPNDQEVQTALEAMHWCSSYVTK